MHTQTVRHLLSSQKWWKRFLYDGNSSGCLEMDTHLGFEGCVKWVAWDLTKGQLNNTYWAPMTGQTWGPVGGERKFSNSALTFLEKAFPHGDKETCWRGNKLDTHPHTLAHPAGPESPGNRGSGRSRPCCHRTRACHTQCCLHTHQYLQKRHKTQTDRHRAGMGDTGASMHAPVSRRWSWSHRMNFKKHFTQQ